MKKNRILLILGVISFASLIIGSTFAYFTSIYTTIGTAQRINIKTKAITNVLYNTGSQIELINANPGSSATATFNLSMESYSSGLETVNYNVIWNITNNTFTGSGELLYTLSKSTDNINWINVSTDVDCTSFTGTNTIASNQSLSSSNGVGAYHYWRLTLTFVNKEIVQENRNANFVGQISVTGLD